AARVVRVTRNNALTETPRASKRRELLQIYAADYDYNLNSYPTGFNQNLTLRSSGRIGDGRFSLTGNFGGAGGAGFGSFRSGTFNYERANGQRLILGDFGTGTDLALMSSTVRGAWAQTPAVGSTRLTAFAGRSIGGLFSPSPLQTPTASPSPSPTQLVQPFRQTYDTNVAGAYLTFGASAGSSYRSNPLLFSTGVLTFDGAARRGRMLTSSVRASSARYSLQADVGVGSFRGTQEGGAKVSGAGVAADVSGSFDVREDLTVQGQYSYSSRNFLTTQAGALVPHNLKSLGLTWKPARWLTASASGTTSTRPDRPGLRDRFATATVNLTPTRYLSSVFVSHTEANTGGQSGSYTLVNAFKNFDRWQLFLNGSRIKNAVGSYESAQVGATLRLRESDSLQLSQTFGSRASLGGTVDWSTQSLLTKRVGIGAGLGYSRSGGSSLNVYERLNASVRLPFRQTLQVSYARLPSGTQLYLSLRGSIFSRRESRMEAAAPLAEMNAYGSVSGRVYQDLNFNGRFDEGVDQPQASVRVRVDGNLSVDTDQNGLYRIDNTRVGEHAVALDLLTVRADLTILGSQSQQIDLQPGLGAVVDFRTVRTGRIKGAVWLDANGDGVQQPDEKPLADARILMASGRDTLTDEQGEFVIGDLPPGLYVVLVDIKTLPDNTVVRANLAGANANGDGSLQLTVAAGAETGGVRFAV
ncbi:MAG TPA: SdrD B-like domain-containing protein, partial [Pyrinomonadaceae bacterium]|nr:SdrD B-like domain-containing protein [Pyrinomonadaceae bacterium]